MTKETNKEWIALPGIKISLKPLKLQQCGTDTDVEKYTSRKEYKIQKLIQTYMKIQSTIKAVSENNGAKDGGFC